MAMDKDCVNQCCELKIEEFGENCRAKCSVNAQRSLTQIERHVILYSMVYVSSKNTRGEPIQNMDPNVRE